jgi:hypothetical protein
MVLPLLLTAGDYQLLLFFWRNGQPKYRKLTFTSYVGAARALRIGQVERPANFAAIDLRIATPGFFDAAAFLLDSIGALAGLLDFDFMVGKLLQGVRNRGFTGCQREVLSFTRSGGLEFGPGELFYCKRLRAHQKGESGVRSEVSGVRSQVSILDGV